MSKKKKIVVDARFWGPKDTGFGRYVKNLLENLPSEPKINVVLIVSDKLGRQKALSRYKKLKARFHPYSLLAQFEMLWLLKKISPDLLYVPHFAVPFFWRGKLIITIHDLIKHVSKGKKTTTRQPAIYWLKYCLYLILIKYAVNRAGKIIVPVRYWKKRLIDYYQLPAKKIKVVYEGVDKSFLGRGAELAFRPRTPYLVYVGNVYPHKNVETLLKAVKLLNGEVHLYISCARSIFWSRLEKMIDKLEIGEWVTHIGFASDQELVTLIRNSLAFATASLVEGFGLPGLEAMAIGAPVISSNASCLPEVYGQAALYFNPHKPKDLANKIKLLLKNPQLRERLIKSGKKQVKKYSWQKMAKEIWGLFKELLEKQ